MATCIFCCFRLQNNISQNRFEILNFYLSLKSFLSVHFGWCCWTKWAFRAPELLWGARQYGTGVDMWAVGCILAELIMRNPIFPGDSDLEQLNLIFSKMGTPTATSWPNHHTLRYYVQFKPIQKTALDYYLSTAPDDLLLVAENMLTLNPLNRFNASQVLQMSFFSNYPPPTPCAKLPKKPTIGQKRKKFHDEHLGISKKLVFD